ncbi:EcsC family protein [Luteococcus sp. Sow4_B9]|uniref:EcsC family protein n=1 Tax=Luteococcus sp. Sow4_B9 TaxID=3438792 RepID=UPI003F9B0718
MGLFDILKGQKADVSTARSALEQANDPSTDDGAISSLIESILSIGIDGKKPFDSAAEVADDALSSAGGDVEKAVNKVVRSHITSGAAGGLITSIGGFITMPIAIPANLLEFYVQATRMTAAVAKLRGYDISQPNIRTAVLLTLVGSNAEDVLAKAGVTTASGRFTSLALRNLPRPAMMMVNKAVGFRLLKSVGQGTLAKLGKGVPVIGGAVGGVLDGYMMNRIGEQALQEFPAGMADAANQGNSPL